MVEMRFNPKRLMFHRSILHRSFEVFHTLRTRLSGLHMRDLHVYEERSHDRLVINDVVLHYRLEASPFSNGDETLINIW